MEGPSLRHRRRPFPAVAALVASTLAAAGLLPAAASSSVSRQAVLDQYCIGCHNEKSKAGGIVLQKVDASNPALRPDLWEKVIRKLNNGEMPPPRMPRPDAAMLKALSAGLVSDLDVADRANAIRRPARDPAAEPARVRQCNPRSARNRIAGQGRTASRRDRGRFRQHRRRAFDVAAAARAVSEGGAQGQRVRRRRGRSVAGHGDFPAPEAQSAGSARACRSERAAAFACSTTSRIDGEYSLRAFLERNDLPKLEGVRFFQTRVEVKAGPHVVVATFPDEFAEREGPVPNVAGPGGPALGGPLDTRGSAIHPTLELRVDQPPRQAVRNRRDHGGRGGLRRTARSADDGSPGDLRTLQREGRQRNAEPAAHLRMQAGSAAEEEPDCASKILSTIARRAFRRDVTAAEVKPFLAQYEAARRKHDFDASIAAAIRDLLLAPDFLFRLEFDPPGAAPGSAQRVTDWELASRLSFFLWSSIPDDELLRRGAARQASQRQRSTRRCAACSPTPAAAVMADNFAGAVARASRPGG